MTSQTISGLNSSDPDERFESVCELIKNGSDQDLRLLAGLLDDPVEMIRGASGFGNACAVRHPKNLTPLNIVQDAVKGLAWWLASFYVENENREETFEPSYLPTCVSIALGNAQKARLIIDTDDLSPLGTVTALYVNAMAEYELLDNGPLRYLALHRAQLCKWTESDDLINPPQSDLVVNPSEVEAVDEHITDVWFHHRWGILDDLIDNQDDDCENSFLLDWVEWDGNEFEYKVDQLFRSMRGEYESDHWQVTQTDVKAVLQAKNKPRFSDLIRRMDQECSATFNDLNILSSARAVAYDLEGR